MVSTYLPNDVCAENAYRKFNLQVYADPPWVIYNTSNKYSH